MGENFYEEVSKKYRGEGRGQLSLKEVEAYLAARMPATLAATSQVLYEVSRCITEPIKSFLDLGAGPGTGLLAAREHFSSIQVATLVEKNVEMISKGKELVNAEWVGIDLKQYTPTPHDLVLFSYSLSELSKKKEILKRAWKNAQVLVVVEPGTPRGFSNILEAREWLIALGGQMIAPCPHMEKCPMKGSDWCHFSIRLDRSQEHRQLKGAKLGFEDEKYSYVAFGKGKYALARGRILRHPQKRSGHVTFKVCATDGLIEETISRKQGALYKRARKANWGDVFPPKDPTS